MAYLMFKKSSPSSSSKKDDDVVVEGKSKHHNIMMMIKCKKHPKHKQSPGVCSLCLREKLSHISSTSISLSKCVTLGSYSSSSASSLSSYYSSSSSASSSSSSPSSSCSSPMYKFTNNNHQGNQYSCKNNKVLTKSRSLAFVPRMGSDKQQQGNETKKKPNGIFSKLLIKPRSKKTDEALVHSTTTKEIIVAI